MIPRRWLFFLYYIACAGMIALVAGKDSWVASYRLATQGIETRAEVVAASCADSPPLVYRFNLGGKSYEGRGDGGYGNPPCEKLKTGDHVRVAYVPSRPEINQPGNVTDRLGRESAAIAMAALFLPLVLLFFFFVLRRILVPGTPAT